MIKVIKDNSAFISYEDMGDWVYLHEWKNKAKDMSGARIGRRFLKMIKKPIIASTLKDKVKDIALKNGFDIYKRVDNRVFLIRR